MSGRKSIESIEQEISELKRYQAAKDERDKLAKEIIKSLQRIWYQMTGDEYVPDDATFTKWMVLATPDQIEEAIKIMGTQCYKISGRDERTKYFAAILHNITGTRR